MTPGEIFRAARLAHKCSTRYLATLLGTSPSQIHYVSNGRPIPTCWLPLLPREIAVPVLRALVAQKHEEINNLMELLQKLIDT